MRAMFARSGSRYGWQARAVSSAGRAPALQAGGRRFEPVTAHRGTPLPATCLGHAFFGLCDAARGGLDFRTRLVRSVPRPLGLPRQALRLALRLAGLVLGGTELLLRLLQRVLRPLLLGPRRGPSVRPRRRRRTGAKLADDLEALRAHRLHETAAGQDLPAVLGDRGRAERLGDLVERGGRGAAPLLEKVLGRARESGDRLPLCLPGLLEGLPVGSGERSGL